MNAKNMGFSLLLSMALIGCSGAELAEGEGGLVFVDGVMVQLNISEVTMERDDRTMQLRFDIASDQGEGQCDMEAYSLEQPGSYQISILACDFGVGDDRWSTRPPSGQQMLSVTDTTLEFSAGGELSKNARTGPPYQIMFEGSY